MKILGVIPARKGSKGIKGKNIKKLAGKPLIAYTIESALKSQCFDRLIVSTDGEEIANISKKYGGYVPFLRPDELSTDTSKGVDAILHAISYLESKGEFFDAIVNLQPTSPLRTSNDIANAINIFKNNDCTSVISLCEAFVHPYLFKSIDEEGAMQNFIDTKIKVSRRQDMPNAYQLNGAIYITSVNHLKDRKGFYGGKVLPYIMPQERSIDIDDDFDFMIAEAILDNIKKELEEK